MTLTIENKGKKIVISNFGRVGGLELKIYQDGYVKVNDGYSIIRIGLDFFKTEKKEINLEEIAEKTLKFCQKHI